MQQVSSMRQLIEYILIGFLTYLLLSGAIAIIGGYNYRSILTDEHQLIALLFIYWWIPIFRMCDIEAKNKGN